MNKLKMAGYAMLSTIVLAAPAQAVTITNKDSGVQLVTVQIGATRTDHKINAGDAYTGECQKGCTLRLAGGSKLHYANPSDTFIIKDGKLHPQVQ